MSRTYGPIRQIAFVVRDLDAALRYWTETLGVGPFFVMRNVSPEDFQYRGAPSPSPRMSLALGNSGDLQVELIEQHDDHPSAYRDFLDSGREGMQHVSAWVTHDEYDGVMKRMLDDGVAVAHSGAMAAAGVRFAYFATDTAPGGLLYEIADVLEPQIYPLMEMIAAAAKDWDGTDPVRAIG
jgi:catechol 2,3-dioxygenase-like lactoylglutathione lyase family enzyme